MKHGIGEMLRRVSNAPKKERAALLRSYIERESAMWTAIQIVIDEGIQWDFEPGWSPEYEPSQYLDQEGLLHQQMRFMGKFMVGGPYPGMDPEKRKNLFVQLLETVTPDDAEYLVAALSKRLPFGLPNKLVYEAVPEIAPAPKAKAADEKKETEDSDV